MDPELYAKSTVAFLPFLNSVNLSVNLLKNIQLLFIFRNVKQSEVKNSS